mmetsp:Transcript_17481/g.42509  ORF Transcript_17481/g.42509 Transcript_17481/m.42509 type:complete len:1170 (+) Transcript_17481:127-3636(+)
MVVASETMSGTRLQRNDALVIVSTMLQDFYELNTVETVATSGKILATLFRNAVKKESDVDDPKKLELYRKVRLTNPKIKQHIVEVSTALDLLGLAGFVQDGPEYLRYTAEGDDTVIQLIYQGLDAKVKEFETTLSITSTAVAPPPSSSPKSSPSSKNANDDGGSPFLAEEERLKRLEKIKAMKKAKKAERELAKERWREDMEERKAAADRREALLNSKVEVEAKQGLAMNVHITTRSATSGSSSAPVVLPKSFEDPNEEMVSATRRQLIQLTMKDETMTPTQKQQKIQALMKAGPELLQSSSAGPSPKDSAISKDGNNSSAKTATIKEAPSASEGIGTDGAGQKDDDTMDTKLPAKEDLSVGDDSVKARVRAPKNPSDDWKGFIKRVPRCAAAEGIRNTSAFYNNKTSTSSDMSVPQCLKRLFKEFDGLEKMLPSDPNCSIWLRFDEETPQYLRVLMAAPLPGPTPYSGGLFSFDIYVPNDYPQVNPKVQLLTTGDGKVRFGPNLYACGKVCLSLLGTWSGPGWDPSKSSLYQVLISIQGLLLGCEHPYYLEPGHGGWEGKVKEGDFQTKGQTLSGNVVQEEVGIPQQVVLYEDKLRTGTAKYAMNQHLGWSMFGSKSKTGLEPFYDIIQAHFCENREAIHFEVRNWMNDYAYGRNRSDGTSKAIFAIDELSKVLPRLESLFDQLHFPKTKRDDSMATNEEDERKGISAAEQSSLPTKEAAPVAAARGAVPSGKRAKAESPAVATKRNKNDPQLSDNDLIELKRKEMKDAAEKGNFMSAGKLQEELKRLESLRQCMKEAAEMGDFIRAGRLQAQFKALTANESKATKSASHSSSAQQEASIWNDDDDSDALMQDEDGGDSDEEDQLNVFAPPGFNTSVAKKNHLWGAGNQLGNTASLSGTKTATTSNAKPSLKKAPPMLSIPRDQLCRLRIRLPNDQSIVEDFEKSSKLSTVYQRLEYHVEENETDKSSVAAPTAARGGTFAQPLSSAGFTLLLARPKREFSLELHGTKTLEDLNLSPSATLTVMRSYERGIVFRGEVEDRLRGAQGDAMSLEGLSYEGLMELTERVGTAAPQKDASFLNLTRDEFEENTETLSPASAVETVPDLIEKGTDDEFRCSICLGSYDATDKTLSLSKIKHCGHTMHKSCLETWLRTHSSCPLCKTSIRSSDA